MAWCATWRSIRSARHRSAATSRSAIRSRAMVDDVVKRFGRLDILINDAAYNKSIPFKDLDGLTYEEWTKIIDINLTGPMLTTKAVGPVMKRQGSGRIVNISSVAGLGPTGSSIAYAVSKAGLIHLTKCMAVALAPEVLVNCVAPGLLEGTRATANLRPEAVEINKKALAAGRCRRQGRLRRPGRHHVPHQHHDRPDHRHRLRPHLPLTCVYGQRLVRAYYVYILTSVNRNAMYVGVTNNLENRVAEHRRGKGSAFTPLPCPYARPRRRVSLYRGRHRSREGDQRLAPLEEGRTCRSDESDLGRPARNPCRPRSLAALGMTPVLLLAWRHGRLSMSSRA